MKIPLDIIQFSFYSPTMNNPTTQKSAAPLVFVLTGAMSRPRAEIAADIEDAGHTVKASITAEVTHLVQSDPFSQSSKSKKAAALGVTIIGEDQLMTLINH